MGEGDCREAGLALEPVIGTTVDHLGLICREQGRVNSASCARSLDELGRIPPSQAGTSRGVGGPCVAVLSRGSQWQSPFKWVRQLFSSTVMAQREPLLLRTQEGNDMGSPRSLDFTYRLPDCVRCVPLMCSTRCLNVIRRPPGFGRSAFLSTVTDCLDVLSPRPCKELWSGPLSGSCPRFDFNCGQILHIDLGRLTYETDEQLKENTANLLRSAVTRFLDKYQSCIGFSDKERTEVLAQCDPNGLLEDAMASAGLIQMASTDNC